MLIANVVEIAITTEMPNNTIFVITDEKGDEHRIICEMAKKQCEVLEFKRNA